MKLFAAALLVIFPGAFAQVAPSFDQTSVNFTLNQATQSLNLEQKDFETLYRTDQVPDTCYRGVVQGTRTECHTEYDRSCSTQHERQCHNESFPVCQTVPRSSCSTQSVCTTENSSVCNSHGCTTVPRRSCHNENRCSVHNDSVCHSESRQRCEDVAHQVCHDIPRQACRQVDNIVQVPYACTRPVQVPIGQALKMDTKAIVNVSFANFSELGQLPDAFTAQLANGNVSVKIAAPSTGYLFQMLSQTRTEQTISATEKLVTYQLVIQATSIQKLNSFLSLQISNPKLYFDHLDFSLSGQINVPFKGHFKLVQRRALAADLIIVDDDFKSNAIVTQGAVSTMMFNNFGVTNLRSKLHYITINLGVDLDALKTNLINPEAMTLIQNQGQPITSDTSAYPSN